ncbi:MAG TPA: hypothetical protein VFX05_09290 [Casimicrobiaceae bacterium]|nr:hypothetical protein [Casimicrobiaceae bacterium]
MNVTLLVDRRARRLRLRDGRSYDPATRAWGPGDALPDDAEPIAARRALAWLANAGGVAWRVPVGVIGPREIDADRFALAEAVGYGLAVARVPLLCGGRGGIMEAACIGAARGGGVSIGLLPEADPSLANAHASLVIATGIGEARNALIARASACLVAIGDSYGTLSEVALGRQFGKRVIGLAGAARVDGVEHVADVDAALERVAEALLGLAPVPPDPAAR